MGNVYRRKGTAYLLGRIGENTEIYLCRNAKVGMWSQWHTYQGKQPQALRSDGCFYVINDELYEEFDEFRKLHPNDFVWETYLEEKELLTYWVEKEKIHLCRNAKVEMWSQWHTYQGKQPQALRNDGRFYVINNELYEEFDEFRKLHPNDFVWETYIEEKELLTYWVE